MEISEPALLLRVKSLSSKTIRGVSATKSLLLPEHILQLVMLSEIGGIGSGIFILYSFGH